MPSSHHHQLNEIVELIVQTNPKSLLDVGIGNGKFGFLAREYLDVYTGQTVYGNRTHRIDGIEGCEKYVTDVHRAIYDSIFIGNAITILPTLESKYDLILLIDVLEHFTRQEGTTILDYCTQRASNVLVSTPIVVEEQGDNFNNQYERHRSQWSAGDFRRFPSHFFVRNPLSLLCYIGDDAQRVKAAVRRDHRKATVKTYLPFVYRGYRFARRLFGH